PSRSNVHGDTSDVPIEMQEAFHPYRFESYQIRQDSAGPGRFRGGVGVIKTYRITGPCRLNLKVDRTKCPPWGLAGGGDAEPAQVEIRRATGEVLRVLKQDHELRPGDQVLFCTGGGGGYGPPWQREIASVLEDVAQGYVSREAAAAAYAVVIGEDGALDAAATRELRKRLAHKAVK
ncbi:MAG: hydantoinase B/oxoprolinase family protein, partial [Betaproteobacteria bacterium]|nr:hydantoinase B/oxoprolinase family protein [Betaproteobacteria bacterium]